MIRIAQDLTGHPSNACEAVDGGEGVRAARGVCYGPRAELTAGPASRVVPRWQQSEVQDVRHPPRNTIPVERSPFDTHYSSARW